MNKKRVKKLAIGLIVLLMVIAGTLAWLTTGDFKKGKIGAADFDLLVEKVVYDEDDDAFYRDDAAEDGVAESITNDSGYTAAVHYVNDGNEDEGLFPISSTNESAIAKRETKYIRISNMNTDTDAYVEISLKNFALYDNETGQAITDEKTLADTFKGATLLLTSPLDTNIEYKQEANINSFNNDFYEIAELGLGYYGYSTINENMMVEEDLTLDGYSYVDTDLYTFEELRTGEYKTMTLPFILAAGRSVVIPFKVFLNENATNLLQDNSIFYEISVNGRNYLNGDPITTVSGRSVVNTTSAMNTFLTAVKSAVAEEGKLTDAKESVAKKLLDLLSNGLVDYDDLSITAQEALLATVEKMAQNNISNDELKNDINALIASLGDLEDDIDEAENDAELKAELVAEAEDAAEELGNDVASEIIETVQTEEGAATINSKYQATIHDDNIVLTDQLIIKYYLSQGQTIDTSLIDQDTLNEMRTYIMENIYVNADDILDNDDFSEIVTETTEEKKDEKDPTEVTALPTNSLLTLKNILKADGGLSDEQYAVEKKINDALRKLVAMDTSDINWQYVMDYGIDTTPSNEEELESYYKETTEVAKSGMDSVSYNDKKKDREPKGKSYNWGQFKKYYGKNTYAMPSIFALFFGNNGACLNVRHKEMLVKAQVESVNSMPLMLQAGKVDDKELKLKMEHRQEERKELVAEKQQEKKKAAKKAQVDEITEDVTPVISEDTVVVPTLKADAAQEYSVMVDLINAYYGYVSDGDITSNDLKLVSTCVDEDVYSNMFSRIHNRLARVDANTTITPEVSQKVIASEVQTIKTIVDGLAKKDTTAFKKAFGVLPGDKATDFYKLADMEILITKAQCIDQGGTWSVEVNACALPAAAK